MRHITACVHLGSSRSIREICCSLLQNRRNSKGKANVKRSHTWKWGMARNLEGDKETSLSFSRAPPSCLNQVPLPAVWQEHDNSHYQSFQQYCALYSRLTTILTSHQHRYISRRVDNIWRKNICNQNTNSIC